MGYAIDIQVNEDGSVTRRKLGGTLEDASAVKMANGESTQKAITDLQARDINTFGTSDRWNGGSYTKGQYTIYQDTLYECLVNNSNVVPTNTTYWKKVSLAELSSNLKNIVKRTSISGTTDGEYGVINNGSFTLADGYIVHAWVNGSTYTVIPYLYAVGVSNPQWFYRVEDVGGNKVRNASMTINIEYIK